MTRRERHIRHFCLYGLVILSTVSHCVFVCLPVLLCVYLNTYASHSVESSEGDAQKMLSLSNKLPTVLMAGC